MNKMTIDEAIKHCEEVAEENETVANTRTFEDGYTVDEMYCDDTECVNEHLDRCVKCAKEHRQLAEWLKDYKRLKEQEHCGDAISRKKVLNTLFYNSDNNCEVVLNKELQDRIKSLPPVKPTQSWIPVSERLPSKEECKEWIDKNLGGIGYLYPCLVTRYSSINPDRTKNNPYVAKHYYDGEDFVNNGEEVCSEDIVAWMPLPEPYRAESEGEE